MRPEAAAEDRDMKSVSAFFQSTSQQPLLKGVQIFRAGDYSAKNKGKWTEADLQQIAKNFEMLKASGEHIPPLKSSHEDDNRGNPVLGWAERVWAQGKDLFADIRLVSNRVMDLVKAKAFRFRSAELHDGPRPWTRPDGTKLANVLRAVSFVPIPEVKGMEEISASLADSALGFVALAEEADQAHSINFEEQGDMKMPEETKTTEGVQGAAAAEGTTEGQGTAGHADNADACETEDEKKKKAEMADKAKADAEAKKAEEEAAMQDKAKKAEEEAKKKADEEAAMQAEEEEKKKKKGYGTGYGYPVPVKSSDASALARFGDSAVVIPVSAQFNDADMQAALESMDPASVRLLALQNVKATRQAAFGEAEAWVKAQVEAGKILPAFRDLALALASPNLGGLGKVSYADGQDPLPVNALFRMFVEGGKAAVQFGETATQKGANSGQDAGVNMSDAEAESEACRVFCQKTKAEWAAMSETDKTAAVKLVMKK